MGFLNDVLSISAMGESDRLDYALQEHRKLAARFDRLLHVLATKGVVTAEDLATVVAEDVDGTRG